MRRTITNAQGEELAYKFHRGVVKSKRKPRKDDRPPCLIIGHGVTGDFERPVVVALAKAAAAKGIHAVRFCFSGNGESQGRFAESNITKEVEDLGAVVDSVVEAGYTPHYAGHSMGAAVGIIRAAEDRRIRTLICVAPMIHTRRFVDAEFGDVTPGKGNMWGTPGCRLSTAFIDDLKSLDTVLPKMSEIHAPIFIIHGAKDDVIPWVEARAAFDFANEPKKLIQMTGVDHVFEGRAGEVMAKAAIDWLVTEIRRLKKVDRERTKSGEISGPGATPPVYTPTAIPTPKPLGRIVPKTKTAPATRPKKKPAEPASTESAAGTGTAKPQKAKTSKEKASPPAAAKKSAPTKAAKSDGSQAAKGTKSAKSDAPANSGAKAPKKASSKTAKAPKTVKTPGKAAVASRSKAASPKARTTTQKG